MAICCLPELFIFALFGDQKTKTSVADVHKQGLDALLVIGLIALCLLMIIAYVTERAYSQDPPTRHC